MTLYHALYSFDCDINSDNTIAAIEELFLSGNVTVIKVQFLFSHLWLNQDKYVDISERMEWKATVLLSKIITTMWTQLIKEIFPLKNQYQNKVKETEEVQLGYVVVLFNELDMEVTWPFSIFQYYVHMVINLIIKPMSKLS